MLPNAHSSILLTQVFLLCLIALGGCKSPQGYIIQENDDLTFASSGTIFADEEFTEQNLCAILVRFELADIEQLEPNALESLTKQVPTRCNILSGVARTKNPIDEMAPVNINITALPDQDGKTVPITIDPQFSMVQTTNSNHSEPDHSNPPQDKPQVIVRDLYIEGQRNNFVSYVMALSEHKCGAYKAFILKDKAKINSWLGGLSTLFAGTSAVVSHAATASAFAAGSGAASGINSILTQERFANLAVEVITAGIDQRRKSIEEEIKNKFDQNLIEYPVGLAIKDALAYHGSCNAVTGFEVAKASIDRVNDPGIKQLKETLGLIGLDISVTEKEPE